MRILIIGGTGFIGSFITRGLAEQGHEVAVFHRGSGTSLPAVRHIRGDRRNLAVHRQEFERFSPDVAVDCIASTGAQVREMLDLLCGVARRLVVLSSADVYRAHGVLLGFDVGPLQPVPLTEDSDLRTQLRSYPPEALQRLRDVFPWLEDDYDKIPVEQAALSDRGLPGTVLRLPMVYGPGDPLHRLHPILKRMDDARPVILVQNDAADWRGPRGYVENVASAIVLATISPNAVGRTYNIGEPQAFSGAEWIGRIGNAIGWRGRVITLPKDRMPAHLRVPYRNEQHWTTSTQRIRDELGFAETVPLATALARTIAWERANPPARIDPAQFDYAAEDAAVVD